MTTVVPCPRCEQEAARVASAGLAGLRLPPQLLATAPAPQRDAVRLLVGRQASGAVSHHAFRELPSLLRAGDVLVVNTSRTLPAAVDGRIGNEAVVVHFSTRRPPSAGGGRGDGRWVVEVRRPDGRGSTLPRAGGPAGARIALAGGAALVLETPLDRRGERLWIALPLGADGRVLDVPTHLYAHGRPIRYAYTERDQPLAAYQTVFATGPGPDGPAGNREEEIGTDDVYAYRGETLRGVPGGASTRKTEGRPQPDGAGPEDTGPEGTGPGGATPDGAGSAEMPSAGRPFTAALVTKLVSRGVQIAPITLHTGVASAEAHEPPYAEPYLVPAATAWQVNAARAAGGRVIAVGTTAVRALESAAGADGRVHPAHGWTELVITPERGVRAVDGLLTGLHEPQASHLLMLRALSGDRLLENVYTQALRERYLWHEFGDVNLLLP